MNSQAELTMPTPLSPMGKVYSYIRFSSDKQRDGHSIDRQSRYAEIWAAEHGMLLDEKLRMRDEGLSAFHQRHVKQGAFGVFLRSIEAGIVPPGSVLIVEGLDRLSRAEPVIAQAQLSSIINAGVTVVTAADGKTYSRESVKANPMDLIYSLLVMIRAHEESETKSQRGKKAIEKHCQEFVLHGFSRKIPGGMDPTWVAYDNKAKRFEIVEEHAATIRRAVAMWLEGYSAKRIEKAFRDEGISTPYAGNSISIGNLLKKRTHNLIGTRIVSANGTEYRLENYYPAVIDRETYHRLIASFHTAPKKVGREPERPCIFTGSQDGLFRCGYCGELMGADNVGRAKNSRRARCTNRQCMTRSVPLLPLEKAVVDFCCDQLNLNSLVGQDRSAEIKSRLAQSRTMLAGLEKQLDRLVEAMMSTDKPAAAFAKRASEIEDQIAALKDAIRVDESVFIVASTSSPTHEAAIKWRTLAADALGTGGDNGDYDARIKIRRLVAETFSKVVYYRYGVNAPAVRPMWERTKESELVLVSRSGVTRHLRFDRHGELIGMVDEDRSPASQRISA